MGKSVRISGRVTFAPELCDVRLIDRHTCSGLLSDTPMPRAKNIRLHARRSRTKHRQTRHEPMLVAALLILACMAPVALHAGMPRGQKHESRHEIDQLEETWRDAVLKSNTTVMDSLLADDYMAITASGTLQTKEQALASLRTGRFHLATLDISDRKVRFYGSTAVVTSLASIQGTTGDGDVSGNYRYTRVYVKDPQGAWKIVSFEVSKIREPGEHK
jgi:ketosteroid isomerase-like protein